MPHALLTGATGYVGSRLCRLLTEQGWTVHAVIRPGSDQTRVPPAVTCHVYDGDPATLIAFVARAQPDVVFHLASVSRSDGSARSVDAMLSANLNFGVHLLNAMAQHGCRNLVNAGTYAEYDVAGSYRPNSFYAATKHAFHALAAHYVAAHGFRFTDLILYDVYGPSDWRPKFLTALLAALRSGESIDASPGRQNLDFVYVDDIARGFLRAGELLLEGETAADVSYRLASDMRFSLIDFAETLFVLAGRRVDVRWGARPYPPGQIMEPLVVGPTLPGWQASISLREGLTAVLQDAPVR
jgi:nucleoside-diphosphate-sugar epimerase